MKTISDLSNNLTRLKTEFAELYRKAPHLIGKTAENYIKQNFETQGFDHQLLQWNARKKKTDRAYDNYPQYKGTVYSSKSPLLWQSGNLRDSIKYEVSGTTIKVGIFDTYYKKIGQAHNEGLNHQPKRKFLGWSEGLNRQLKKDVMSKFTELFNRHLK